MIENEKISEQTAINSYFKKPHEIALPNSSYYKILRVMQVPSSRELNFIRNAIEVIIKNKESS